MHGDSTIRGLMAFVTIAEHGSINRAARALNVSQPSLTRTLQQFEATIGATVFVREAKGAVLNDLGKQLLAHAQVIRSETTNAVRTIEQFRREKRRQLHIGAVTNHPLVQFAEATIEFMRQEPDLFLRITHGSMDELMGFLKEGELEMVFGPLPDAAEEQTYVQDTIYHDVLSLYCRSSAPIAKLPRVTMQELSAASWVLPPAGMAARDKVMELFAAAGNPGPSVMVEVENVPMRRALVLRSDCVSVFHAHHVHTEIESGALAKVNFDWTSHFGPIGSIRLAPHTPTSLRLLRAFEARYVAAGLCRQSPEKKTGGKPPAKKANGQIVYARH